MGTNHIDFKEKARGLEERNQLLEAFLLQSAYIESLLRRQFGYQLSLNISNAGVHKAIKTKNQHLSSVLQFCRDADWLSEEGYSEAKGYFDERNLIVHDLVAANTAVLNQRLKKLLTQGWSILEDHGNLERFMGLAQRQYSLGKMTRGKEVISLSQKEKEIFELRVSGKTLEEVGRKFGVTRERVRQIQNRVIQKMEGLVKVGVEKTKLLAKRRESLSASADVFINEFCKEQNISLEQLLSASRKADLVLIRHWTAYSLREKYKLSFPEIGKKLNRDHTTIIHAHNRIKDLLREAS